MYEKEARRVAAGPRQLECWGDQARRDAAVLIPLRLFIGVGWLRAFAEKAIDPDWRDGAAVGAFLSDRLRDGDVAFPAYEIVVRQVWLPHATSLGWLVMLGQLLTGMAILAGGFTNAALLGGLFMNLNFLLVGEPAPSAFYLVIQVALLLGHAGAIFGVDARLGRVVARPWLIAQPEGRRRARATGRSAPAAAGALSLAVAAYALVCVSDWSPAGSVEDPAMVLAVLAAVTGCWAAIEALRAGPRGSRQPAAAQPSVRSTMPRPRATV